MTRLLTDEEIERQLTDLPDWRRGEGDANQGTISATLTAPDFLTGLQLVSEVGAAAEQMQHHPDIDIRYTSVTFALSTHDLGGLSQLDIELAHQISQEARRLAVAPADPADPTDPTDPAEG